MGSSGYRRLLEEREVLVEHMKSKLSEICAEHGERMLSTPSNRISFGVTLDTFTSMDSSDRSMDQTYLGSMLFTRCVSGTRVIRKGETNTICGHSFQGFGSSIDDYPHTYMTAACAIGVTKEEIDRFIGVLDKSMKAFRTKAAKKKNKGSIDAGAAAEVETCQEVDVATETPPTS
jgi:O-phospho-L-seryl-tRNASec:L-selenocysteinyl-tRNA synthase